MKTEFLFGEVCNFYGDPQNVTYLAQSSRDPQVINTALTDEPFFVKERPDIVVMASMSEKLQRKVIEKLRPLMPRIRQLIDDGVVFLCTGNSCEIFCKKLIISPRRCRSRGSGFSTLKSERICLTDITEKFSEKPTA